jgi:3-oxoacyl-[acyl-carrier-protein] synthase II
MVSREVVITGLGVVSPIGIGKSAVWESLRSGQSGVRPLTLFDASALPIRIGSEVRGFNAKAMGVPRKSIKVMSRDAQFGVAASILACQDAGLNGGVLAPERLGVILGADRICSSLEHSEAPYRQCIREGSFDFGLWASGGFPVTFPLSFLRVLPNMIASHISIAVDARGPNNTMHHGGVSSLLAVHEATRIIERGAADAMIAGGAASQMDPFDWIRHCILGRLSPRQEPPESVMRPFDRRRDGEVKGEGAACFLLEDRKHAESRGASILARVVSWGITFASSRDAKSVAAALRRAMVVALDRAHLSARDIGHLNAQGLSTVDDDALEAGAIHEVLGDVSVTAPSSFFGNLGASGGAVDMVASVLALTHGLVPFTLNYREPDPNCPLRVVAGEMLPCSRPAAMLVSWNTSGQAAALILGKP